MIRIRMNQTLDRHRYPNRPPLPPFGGGFLFVLQHRNVEALLKEKMTAKQPNALVGILN